MPVSRPSNYNNELRAIVHSASTVLPFSAAKPNIDLRSRYAQKINSASVDQTVQMLRELGVVLVAPEQLRTGAERADRDRLGGVAGGAPVETGLARHHARHCGARGAVGHQVALQRRALEDRLAQVGVELEAGEMLRHELVEFLPLRRRAERAVDAGKRDGDALDHLQFLHRRVKTLLRARAG